MSEQDRPTKKKRGERSVATFDSTAISVHWNLTIALFLIGLLIRFWLRQRYDGLGPYTALGATIVILFVICVSLLGRELTHTQIAKYHGLTVPELSLSATGARIRADSVPPYPRAEFQISGGGLLFTFFAAALLFTIATLSDYYRLNPGFGEILTLLALMNAILMAVNLVPVAPLDTGRMISAILWHRRGSKSSGQLGAGKVAVLAGFCLGVTALGVLFVSVPASGFLAAIAILMAVVGRSQMRRASVRRRLETTTQADIMVKNPMSLPDSLTVGRLEAWVDPEQIGVAYPITRWGSSPIGYVVPLSAAPLSVPERSWTRLDTLMQTCEDVNRSWSGETVQEVLQRIPLTPSTIVVVHDPITMHEVGTVSYSQLEKLFIQPKFWGHLKPPTRTPVPHTSMH